MFVITAELPLGTYRGAGRDRRPEPIPSVTRLHSALLCAAGFGPRAVPDGDELAPCDADQVALRWLEAHPPDGVRIPALQVNRGRVTAYRDDGTLRKSKASTAVKKLAKQDPATAVAVAGVFEWIWSQQPPEPIAAALAALCGDVAHLGTAESPVRLHARGGPATATHELDRDAGMFSPAAKRAAVVEAPAPGRTAELAAAHARATGTVPSMSSDKTGTDEKSLSAIPPCQAVQLLRYVDRAAPVDDVPWPQVVLLPLDQPIEPLWRVKWAVAAHRALIRLVGAGAPPLLTGVYPPGLRPPTNRLALHLLDASMPLASGADAEARSVLAVLVPRTADADDVALLLRTVDQVTSLRGPGGRLARVVGAPQLVSGSRLWAPPSPGSVRLWQTVPASVPDIRGVRGDEWTFTHAALLSLGFVWRDQLPKVTGRREVYYRNLIAAVAAAGAAVVRTRAVRTTDVGAFAHHVHEHAVVRPYHACLWLGDLAPATAVTAIGQSRHLGGGLLAPFDVPEGTPTDEIHLSDASDRRPR